EWRGNIYAMALSKSADGDLIAVGGYGLLPGMVAVLRKNGDILHVLTPQDDAVGWKVAISPDGQHLVHGSDNGRIRHTDLSSPTPQVQPLSPAPPPEAPLNRVRRIDFLNATEFVTVAEDGRVLKWNLTRLKDRPQQIGQFRLPHLFYVAVSPDHRWLAAAG